VRATVSCTGTGTCAVILAVVPTVTSSDNSWARAFTTKSRDTKLTIATKITTTPTEISVSTMAIVAADNYYARHHSGRGGSGGGIAPSKQKKRKKVKRKGKGIKGVLSPKKEKRNLRSS